MAPPCEKRELKNLAVADYKTVWVHELQASCFPKDGEGGSSCGVASHGDCYNQDNESCLFYEFGR